MSWNRRQILKGLAGAGWIPARSVAQPDDRLSLDDLRRGQRVAAHRFDEGRLRELLPSIQRHLDSLRLLRDVELDDRVEPAPVFRARAR